MTYFCPKFDEEQSFFCKLVPENSFLGSKMRFFVKKHRFLTQKWSKRVKKFFFSIFPCLGQKHPKYAYFDPKHPKNQIFTAPRSGAGSLFSILPPLQWKNAIFGLESARNGHFEKFFFYFDSKFYEEQLFFQNLSLKVQTRGQGSEKDLIWPLVFRVFFSVTKKVPFSYTPF